MPLGSVTTILWQGHWHGNPCLVHGSTPSRHQAPWPADHVPQPLTNSPTQGPVDPALLALLMQTTTRATITTTASQQAWTGMRSALPSTHTRAPTPNSAKQYRLAGIHTGPPLLRNYPCQLPCIGMLCSSLQPPSATRVHTGRPACGPRPATCTRPTCAEGAAHLLTHTHTLQLTPR